MRYSGMLRAAWGFAGRAAKAAFALCLALSLLAWPAAFAAEGAEPSAFGGLDSPGGDSDFASDAIDDLPLIPGGGLFAVMLATDDSVQDDSAPYADVIAAAREAQVAGADALERLLVGEELTAEEFLSIDAAALAEIDADLAQEVADAQASIRAEGAPKGATVTISFDDPIPAEDGAAGPGAQKPAAESGATGGGRPAAATPTGSAPALTTAPPEEAQAVDADGPTASTEANVAETPSDAPVADAGTGQASTGLSTSSFSAAETTEAQGGAQGSTGGVVQFTPNPTTEEFIESIGAQARAIANQNDLYASVMIAQAIVESGSGSSQLSKPPYNNLFGIKGSYKGQSVTFPTQEDDGLGSYYTVEAAFRSYPSTRESLQDYAELMSSSYYAEARRSSAATYVQACDYLQGHYATSTTYSRTLQSVILTYNLTAYDGASSKPNLAVAGASPFGVSIAWASPVSAFDKETVEMAGAESPAAGGPGGLSTAGYVVYAALVAGIGAGAFSLASGRTQWAAAAWGHVWGAVRGAGKRLRAVHRKRPSLSSLAPSLFKGRRS